MLKIGNVMKIREKKKSYYKTDHGYTVVKKTAFHSQNSFTVLTYLVKFYNLTSLYSTVSLRK
jgi:hypothetical protein